MCQDCGCGDTNLVPLELQTRILARNDHTAAHNRTHFRDRGILAINLMGGPGSGKTALLEATAAALRNGSRLAALAGDLATDNDAARLSRAGIRSRAITTGQACHLDAEMVHHELHHLDLSGVEYLFIENVGNLVCPAVYDLGQRVNVVTLSLTEGEDKPLKYPTMFGKADLVVLTKFDLLPFLKTDLDRIDDALQHVMPSPRMIMLSSLNGSGVSAWLQFLAGCREAMREAAEVHA